MQLYVVRHGEAAPQASGGDAARPLTSRGAALVAAVGQGLRAAGVAFDLLAASPRVRAQQTAALLADALGGPKPVTEPVLGGGEDGAAILAEVAIWARGADCVAVVGHQPVLGELVMRAVAGPGAPGASLAPACVVRIDFAGPPRAGAGRIAWWMPPELLARVGESRA